MPQSRRGKGAGDVPPEQRMYGKQGRVRGGSSAVIALAHCARHEWLRAREFPAQKLDV